MAIKYFEVNFLRGYRGTQDSVIVEASDEEWAEITFEHHFPKKMRYVFEVKEFIHKAWMKPLEEMEIYRNPYPQLEEIDFSKISLSDIECAMTAVLAKQ